MAASPAKKRAKPVRGFCLSAPKSADHGLFKRLVAEVLPRHGVTDLVLLIRYRFAFASHPAVADPDPLTREKARDLAKTCRSAGIRLIPKMNLFGHQSEKKGKPLLGLLRAHPEFDETPGSPEVGYCRSLCPRQPAVGGVVRDLVDEMLDAFEADAFHIGCDEVFEIGLCPRCKGAPTSGLFAEWTQALYDHIAGKRGAEVWMWGDRLLDSEATGYGKWEASINETTPALDLVPKDIVICDWHYGERPDYPSLRIFTDRGFRLVACPWRNIAGAEAFLGAAFKDENERVLGTLQTSWCDSGAVARYLIEGKSGAAPDKDGNDIPAQVGEVFKRSMALTP